jgi:predicted dehydrogenase
MKSTTGLIIGVGSVGKRHAKVMASRFDRLFVVDTNVAALEWASSELHTDLKCARSLNDLEDELRPHAATASAVIATWGPSHFRDFNQVVNLGVRRVFCEKPLTTSLAQIQSMRELCVEQKVAFTGGLHLRYRGMADFIREASATHLGGPPSSFVVDGGARCMATTGSHWLDLAIDVFGSPPTEVCASLEAASINPRSSDLDYWAGTASWRFQNSRRLTITYDNSSSVHERAVFYSRNGVTEIDSELVVRVYSRNSGEITDDPRITRVGHVLPKPVAEFVPYVGEVLSRQLDEIEGIESPIYNAPSAFDSAEALLAAFESSRLGQTVTLPVSDDLVRQSREWNIS